MYIYVYHNNHTILNDTLSLVWGVKSLFITREEKQPDQTVFGDKKHSQKNINMLKRG